MFSGHYSEAAEEFRSALDLGYDQDWHAEWRLKLVLLGEIQSNLGVEEQVRRTLVAHSLAEVEDAQEDREAIERLTESLRCDALSALAWWQLGKVRMRAGMSSESFRAFLNSAIVSRGNARSWVTGIVLYVTQEPESDGGDHALLPDILWMGYHYCGQGLIDEVRQKLPPDAVEALGEFARAFEFYEPPARRVEFRLLNDTGWMTFGAGEDGIQDESGADS